MIKYCIYIVLFILSCSNHSSSRRTNKVSFVKNDAEKCFYSCEILSFLNKECNPYASDSSKVISDTVLVNSKPLLRDRLLNEDIEVLYSSNPFIAERAKVIYNKKAYDFDSLIAGYKNQDHISSLFRNKLSVIETKKNKYYYLSYYVTNVTMGEYFSHLLILDKNKKVVFNKDVKLCHDNEFLSLKNDSLYLHYFSPLQPFAKTGDTLIKYNLSSKKIVKYWVLDAIDSTKYGMYKIRKETR